MPGCNHPTSPTHSSQLVPARNPPVAIRQSEFPMWSWRVSLMSGFSPTSQSIWAPIDFSCTTCCPQHSRTGRSRYWRATSRGLHDVDCRSGSALLDGEAGKSLDEVHERMASCPHVLSRFGRRRTCHSLIRSAYLYGSLLITPTSC